MLPKLLVALSSAAGVLAMPATGDINELSARMLNLTASMRPQAGTPSSTGQSGGFYYSFWTDNGGNVNYQNGEGGKYSVNWQNCGNFVGGKGWNPGSPKNVSYVGTWSSPGNSYVALYGWTTNPLVEYYILETFGTYNPASNAQRRGSLTVDGSNYDILVSQRVNQPSIQGTSTFQQYWSVRSQKRVGGTIDTGAHFAAWQKAGLRMGTHNYMILATEGYQSSGSASFTVSEAAPVQPQPKPSQTTTTTSRSSTSSSSSSSSTSRSSTTTSASSSATTTAGSSSSSSSRSSSTTSGSASGAPSGAPVTVTVTVTASGCGSSSSTAATSAAPSTRPAM